MTDIVERLRSHLCVFRSYPKQTGADDMAGVVQSIEMAADEIERLRLSVVGLTASDEAKYDIIQALHAQIDLLRAGSDKP